MTEDRTRDGHSKVGEMTGLSAGELVRAGEERLRLAGIGADDAPFDARELFQAASGWTAAEYVLRMRDEVSGDVAAHYGVYITRRAEREPLQRILGYAWFMGDQYEINEETLIPRFDSEAVVRCAEEILRARKTKDELRILDIGTGTGCLLIALLEDHPEAKGLGVDISKRALEAARANAERLVPGQAFFLKSDLFANVSGTYDIILSNPPYIRSADISGLEPEVRDHDPGAALDGGDDGLGFYRRITDEAPHFLKKDGALVFEIGFDQAEDVSRLLAARGFREIKVTKDLSDRDRAVSGVRDV